MANPHLDLLLQLMGGAKQRLGARPSASLNEYVHRRTDPTLAANPFPEMNPPLEGPGYMNAPSPEAETPISRDPWFNEDPSMPDPGEPTLGGAEWAKQRETLVLDMMRAVGIEPRGSYDRYYSQLKEIDDAFIKRIAQKLEINEGAVVSPDALRSLLATEFEAFGTNV